MTPCPVMVYDLAGDRRVAREGPVVIEGVLHRVASRFVVCEPSLNRRPWNVTMFESACPICYPEAKDCRIPNCATGRALRGARITPVLLAGNAPGGSRQWLCVSATWNFCPGEAQGKRYSIGGHSAGPAPVPAGYERAPVICRDLGLSSRAFDMARVKGKFPTELIRHRRYARREDVQAYLDGRGVGGRPRVGA